MYTLTLVYRAMDSSGMRPANCILQPKQGGAHIANSQVPYLPIGRGRQAPKFIALGICVCTV